MTETWSWIQRSSSELMIIIKDILNFFELENVRSVWLQFLGEENQRDWCVSRQIWWGHQVPVFRVTCDQESVYVGATSAEEAVMKAGAKMKISDSDQVIIDQS